MTVPVCPCGGTANPHFRCVRCGAALCLHCAATATAGTCRPCRQAVAATLAELRPATSPSTL